jgi:ribosomal protein S27AE
VSAPTAKWARISERVFKRDRYECQRCGRESSLTVHHLKPRAEGGREVLNNLLTLCSPCHDWVEVNLEQFPELRSKAGITGSYPIATPGRPLFDVGRQGYPHPGDKADIWGVWIRQHRLGAAELIKKYGDQDVPPHWREKLGVAA